MRILIVATPRFEIPPERLPSMIDAAVEWHNRYRDRFDVFGTFPGGGGFAALNVADELELSRMMAEMPFSPYSHHEIRPYVAGTEGMQQLKQVLSAMTDRA
jgi:hypothetical protein